MATRVVVSADARASAVYLIRLPRGLGDQFRAV